MVGDRSRGSCQSGVPIFLADTESSLFSMTHRQTENNPGQFGFTTNFPDEVRT